MSAAAKTDKTDKTDMPVLAMCAGTYREQPATGRLARLFRCVWSHRLPEHSAGGTAVVPDGCSDLIWTGGRLMVIGPDRIAAFPVLPAGETVLGLRFRPGAALRWLDIPLSELVGRSVPLRDVRGDVGAIEEQLADESDTGRRLARLSAWAGGEAAAAIDPQGDMEALFNRLSGGTLHDFSAGAALGERTLRRRSRDHFGYGPKTLERVLRLQRLLGLLQKPASDNLAILAYEAGYADQAHMSRDVKELTMLTPQDIRRQLSA